MGYTPLHFFWQLPFLVKSVWIVLLLTGLFLPYSEQLYQKKYCGFPEKNVEFICEIVYNKLSVDRRSNRLEIYLDNSATTKPCQASVAASVYAMTHEYGNPSSLHKMGFKAECILDQAKKQLAKALSCDTAELVFTSGATESNNLAIFGAASAHIRRGKRIVTTAIEHPSVLSPLMALEKQGFEIKTIYPVNGQYKSEQFSEAVNDNTILVSCMMVNNETGLRLPVEEIARKVKQKNQNTLVHVDGVQGFLKLPLKCKATAIDLLSISGHKVFAPKGIGALYIRKGTRISPILFGGGQQGGLRSGTEPVPLIAAFGAAAEEFFPKIGQQLSHYEKLEKLLLEEAQKIEGLTVYHSDNAVPYIINLSAESIRSEIMLHFLEERKIYVSSGSACSRGKQSHVLAALGLEKKTSDEMLRISFSPDTTEEMIKELITSLKEGLQRLAKR